MWQGGLVRCSAAVAAERGLGAWRGGEGKCLRRAGAAASGRRLLVGLRDGEYAQGRGLPLHWSGVRTFVATLAVLSVYMLVARGRGMSRGWGIVETCCSSTSVYAVLCVRLFMCVRLRGFSTLLYLAFAQGPGCGAGGKKR